MRIRSTPLRLTVLLIAVFTVSLVLSLGAAYLFTRNEADGALHTQVVQEFNSFALERDQGALETRLLNQAALVPRRSLILIYVADRGARIANIAAFPLVDDFSIVDRAQIPGDKKLLADSYLVVSGRAGHGVLILARSREQVSELDDIFTTIFLISLLPTLLLSAMTGLMISRNARRRVEGIRETLEKLADGNLAARVPAFVGKPDDLSQIGDDLNQMAQAQAQAVEAMRQISTDIAHDLKTPIQRVTILLEQLAATGGLSDEQSGIIARASAETHQIVKTFQSLLQIAQMEGGALKSRFAPVDLGHLAVGLVEIYSPSAEQRGQTLIMEPPGPMPCIVSGERNLLGQLIANLIENAMRHTAMGSRIVLSITREAGGITLRCCDNGSGIPEAERAKVLRRLYRMEQSRTTEGTGLGLSLVAAIARLHDARLTLSDNQPGLCVSLYFADRA